MHLRNTRVGLALVLIATLAAMMSCTIPSQDQPEPFAVSGSTMGTTWRMLWIESSVSAETVQAEMEAELARINELMSTWDPESELSLFNASLSINAVKLHSDTLQVIDTALSISRLTHGSYDITLQPVIALWGFNRDTEASTPTDEEITVALDASGHQQLVRVGDTVRKRRSTLAIDVSSVAKGFAVDKLGELAESLGITRYLVDIGGEIRTRGTRADKQPWQIGIESPDGNVPRVIALRDAHIASSGSYRNYRIENGKRLSHIIDGATGRPIEHNLVSVSVVHDSTMLADAWATALLVVGETRARTLIEQQGLIAQLTLWNDSEFTQFTSAEFEAMIVKD